MADFINIHTHQIEKGENAFSIYNISLPCKEFPEEIYFSAGWHPWHIEAYDLPQISNSLEEIASMKNLLAIGECGLDRDIKINLGKQAEVFRLHINMAKKYDKPLIVHCVRAYSDLTEMLKKEKFIGRFIIHNFNGNCQQLDNLLRFNAYFSLGEQLWNPRSRLNKSLKDIPVERIFLETDDSAFSIRETYLFASDLLHIPIEDLKSQVKQNFTSLFGNYFFCKIKFEFI